jgi:hypothetical protein
MFAPHPNGATVGLLGSENFSGEPETAWRDHIFNQTAHAVGDFRHPPVEVLSILISALPVLISALPVLIGALPVLFDLLPIFFDLFAVFLGLKLQFEKLAIRSSIAGANFSHIFMYGCDNPRALLYEPGERGLDVDHSFFGYHGFTLVALVRAASRCCACCARLPRAGIHPWSWKRKPK